MATSAFGNITASGYVSAIGNVYGGNLTTSGLVVANSILNGNLQTLGTVVSNNVSANNVAVSGLETVGTISAFGIITGYTLIARGGQVSATGNIQGNNIIGNGSQLTNVNANTPAFIASISGYGQNLPISPTSVTQFPLIFNNVPKNIGNGYNLTTGIFTTPLAGFYQVSAAFAPGVPNPPSSTTGLYGASAMGLYKNNVPISAGNFNEIKVKTGLGWVIDGSLISTLVYLNVGETIQCKVAYVTNYSGFTTVALIPNSFSACWIHP
jgi:hypothetical protein